MQPEAGKFACDSCNRSYRWTDKLAGKRVKCKCGAVLQVPAEEPAGPDELPPDFASLEPSDAPTAAATPPAYATSAPKTSAKAAATQAIKAAATSSDGKEKISERWWYYLGIGILMIPISIFEYIRLGNLESASGPESIRVTSLEYTVYNIMGRTGVLIAFILLGLLVAGFGVHKFLKNRSSSAAA